MPEARLERTRETLPERYQFGDSGLFGFDWQEIECALDLETGRTITVPVPPEMPPAGAFTANVIEGEHH